MVMASTLTLAFNWRKKVRIRSGLSPKNERARAPFPTRHFSATFNVILMRNPSWKWCRRFRYTLQRIGSAIYVSDVQDDECDGTDGDISTKVAALELICLMRVRELDRIKKTKWRLWLRWQSGLCANRRVGGSIPQDSTWT